MSSIDLHSFDGKNIPHIKIPSDVKIDDLIEIFVNSGYNARQLGMAAKLYEKMIQDNATICLTISGALTPVGFGGIVKTLIENGLIDWVITTGANLYHEEHFANGLPVKQGHFDVDDEILYQKGIVRIRDIFVKYWETLEDQDQIIQKIFNDFDKNLSFTTADFCNYLGKFEKKYSKYPEKSFVIAAHDNDVPVFISTLKDSSLALNLSFDRFKGDSFKLDFVKELLQQASIVLYSEKSAVIELGGGVPKNLAEQTSHLLKNQLHLNHNGHYCLVQITDAREDTGGTSGAPFSQGIGWNQTFPTAQCVKANCDVTIAFPILAIYALSKSYKRKPKRLYKKLDSFYDSMQNLLRN